MRHEAIQHALGYRFRDGALLRRALTHRSYAADNYERLEFLGDSILNMVVAMALYTHFPNLREGELSRLRAQLVRQDTLHGIAERMRVGEQLLLGEGEVRSGGRERPSILADATEALFGAIFLDGGFDAVRAAIEAQYAPLLAAIDPAGAAKDPKTRLQELLQGKRKALPRYELVETRGEAHMQEFKVACIIESPPLRTCGVGNSRRIAEQNAARLALEQIGSAS